MMRFHSDDPTVSKIQLKSNTFSSGAVFYFIFAITAICQWCLHRSVLGFKRLEIMKQQAAKMLSKNTMWHFNLFNTKEAKKADDHNHRLS